MSSKDDFENARQAYEHAINWAKRYGDAAFAALDRAQRLASQVDRDLCQRGAERLLVAYENWRKSSEHMAKVMQEIATGQPRKDKG